MIRGRRKTRTGRVVSDKMDKTVVVAVEWRQTHPIYSKSVKRITKFHAHDEDNQSKVGDVVNIMETRPLSKTKRWRVTQVLSTGDIPIGRELREMPDGQDASPEETEDGNDIVAADEGDTDDDDQEEEA
jgi:small subunit ribosomal protein S17